ncbi:MAG TPA: non-canonical purine NTP pyrophosphatase [Bacillota bacterium]|nr:non-canonical purine NTP pyrophosphatase [Bacillota bacterium]
MSKKLLFGTTNRAKLDYVKTVIQPLPIDIVSLNDLKIDILVEENGVNPGENALIKSRAYYLASHIPTFSFDSGLYLEKFPEEKQPGLLVRRINGKQASDAEMLDYYIKELKKVGGQSQARWITSVALVESDNRFFIRNFTEHTLFTSQKSPIMNPGNPLNSIQIDPVFNKYTSEITPEERKQTKGELDAQIFRFFDDYINGSLRMGK